MHPNAIVRRLRRYALAAALAPSPMLMAEDAPPAVLDAFGLDRGTMVDVEVVPADDDLGITLVRFDLPEEGPIELRVVKRSVRGEHYQLLVAQDDGSLLEVPAPPVATYRGTVSGDVYSRVRLSILPEGVSGRLTRGDGTRLGFEAVSGRIRGTEPTQMVVYSMEDIAPVDAWCGVADGDIDPDRHGPAALSGGLLRAEVIIDSDFPYYERVGGTSRLVGQSVDQVVNLVNDQYNNEVGLDHVIIGVIVRPTAASDPYVGNGLCVEGGLEDQVSDIWSAPPVTPHDIVHLFTGRVESGTIGCNWVGEVCQDNPYGASSIGFNGNLSCSTDLLAHELGHGWGAGHCACTSPPYTMNPNLTCANVFNPTATIPVINAYVAANDGCLDAFYPASCGQPASGTCYASKPSPYCRDESCCIEVCAVDNYCCQVVWDAACAEYAATFCAGCGTDAAGSPYLANGSPGCQNADCCFEVCAADPYCCENTWDGACVSQAFDLCTDCGDPAAGSPYATNTSGSCSSLECCEAVCPIDPHCCDSEWDSTCVELATVECAGCGSVAAGSAYAANGTPGCASAECCLLVCVADPYCCENTWDGICASQAFDLCSNCGSPTAGSPYDTNASGSCNDLSCCEAVCPADPYCCDVSWDVTCVEVAVVECAGCGDPGAGSPYVDHATPGCDSADCCLLVCQADVYCCETAWDASCVNQALEDCGNCGSPASGSAYVANGTPGCASIDCCESVCSVEPLCCNVDWDASCATAAIDLCTSCGEADAGSPYEANGTPACEDLDCCSTVCAIDADCCDLAWDEDCAALAIENCLGCGNPNAGSCNEGNGTPGCADAKCCEIVCASDPFCCETAWDNLCAEGAATLCGSPCVGDIDGNGEVGGADLAVLLAEWGPCSDCTTCPADLDGNCDVGGADLAILLGAWGLCP